MPQGRSQAIFSKAHEDAKAFAAFRFPTASTQGPPTSATPATKTLTLARPSSNYVYAFLPKTAPGSRNQSPVRSPTKFHNVANRFRPQPSRTVFPTPNLASDGFLNDSGANVVAQPSTDLPTLNPNAGIFAPQAAADTNVKENSVQMPAHTAPLTPNVNLTPAMFMNHSAFSAFQNKPGKYVYENFCVLKARELREHVKAWIKEGQRSGEMLSARQRAALFLVFERGLTDTRVAWLVVRLYEEVLTEEDELELLKLLREELGRMERDASGSA